MHAWEQVAFPSSQAGPSPDPLAQTDSIFLDIQVVMYFQVLWCTMYYGVPWHGVLCTMWYHGVLWGTMMCYGVLWGTGTVYYEVPWDIVGHGVLWNTMGYHKASWHTLL